MKVKIHIQIIFLCAIAFAGWNCHSRSSSVTNQDFAMYYRDGQKVMHPQFVLYNLTDSVTRLYFTVNASELLYEKQNGGTIYSARLLLTYKVYPFQSSKTVTDTGHVVLNDTGTPGENKQLAAYVDMDVINPGTYCVEATLRDLNKASIAYALLYLDHNGKNSRNSFLLSAPASDLPLFRNYVDSAEKFVVRPNTPSVKKIFVRHFPPQLGLAPPPYAPSASAVPALPDSSFWVDAGEPCSFTKKGFYIFSTDSVSKGGMLVSVFSRGFPDIGNTKELLFPLRFLTENEEYNRMLVAPDAKAAVDNFWLTNAGSEDRARTVIRQFYNRMVQCNKLFSTQTEGWRTDRGMIYLVMGPPADVYRTPGSETWIYTNSYGPNGLTFIFDHNFDALTDGEFTLQRSITYKNNWIEAVDAWRQGHVYTAH